MNTFQKIESLITGILVLCIGIIPLHAILIIRAGTLGEPGTPLYGIWQYGTIGLYAFDFVSLLLACLFGVWIFFQIRDKGFAGFVGLLRTHADRVVLCAFALVLFSFFSIIWSPDRLLSFAFALRLSEGFFVFLLARFFRPPFAALAGMWILSGVIQSALAFWQYGTQQVVANKWLGMSFHSGQTLGDSVIETANLRLLRAYGSFPHPNMEAAFLAGAFILCVFFVLRSPSKRYSFFLVALANVLLSGLFFTFSRESWLALLVSLVVTAFLFRKKWALPRADKIFFPGRVLIVSLVLTLSVVSLFSLEPLSARLGIGGWQRLEKKSVQERVESVTNAIPIIGETWAKGTGIGIYTLALFQKDQEAKSGHPPYWYQPIHNTYLLVLAELGFFGFLLYVFCITLSFLPMLRKRDISLEQGSFFALALLFVIIGFFDHFFWTVFSGVSMLWFSLGLLAGSLASKGENKSEKAGSF